MTMRYLGTLLLFITLGYAQTAEWLNPFPTGAELRRVKVLSNGTIYAGGEGSTFISSKDSGRTWSVRVLNSTTVSRINGICFPVKDTGWLCSSTGDVYRTTDGGGTFSVVKQFPGRDFSDIAMPDRSTMVISADSGLVVRSSDGGVSWQTIQTPVTVQLYSVTFLDSALGFMCGDNGTVLKTITGGAKWSIMNIGGSTVNLRGIHSRNDTIVISGTGGMFASGNRGDSFSPTLTPETGGSYNAIVFAGNKTLYTGTNLGRAYRSTNFGASWTIMPSKTGATNWLFGCDASSPTFAAFVGRAGTAMVTQQGKDSLRQNQNFTSETFRLVQRVGRTIIAGGLGGVMFRSTDNGETWKSLTLPSGIQTMSCIKMVSTRTIVAAGTTGKLNYSTDAGETWSGQTYGTSRFWGIDVKGNLGLAVNTVGNVYRSTNGGASWTLASSLGNIYLYSVSIVDSMTAFLCTGQQAFQVYKTSNAGLTWSPIFTASTNLFSIFFGNATNGVVVGDRGQIFVTYDAGTTWLDQRQDTLIDLRTVTWYENTIVAAGLGGVILRSTNTGESFQRMNSPTGSTIFAVDMAAPVNGIHSILAAGESGNLFRFSYPVPPNSVNDRATEGPRAFRLSQNYPNPFNPSTVIEYTVPEAGYQQPVVLKVYDVTGRERATLVNAPQVPGTYSVPFDGPSLSSGVYFYRLTVGGRSMTRRMLLMK